MTIRQAFALDCTLRASSLMPRLVLAVKLLKQLEPSIEESVEANGALDGIGGSGAVPALLQASVRTKHPEVNLNAARALVAIGDPGVPPSVPARQRHWEQLVPPLPYLHYKKHSQIRASTSGIRFSLH